MVTTRYGEKVSGMTAIVVGPNDLSGSMGHMAEPRHPDVVRAIETVIARARQTEVFVGIAIGDDPGVLIEWVDKGMQWLLMGTDFSLTLRSADAVSEQVRNHIGTTGKKEE